MKVSQSTVCRWKKGRVIRKHINAIKPTLNDNNKLHRLSFTLSKLQYDEHTDSFKFKSHNNIVHIDEKHFYLTRESQTYYLAPGEVEPHRECQSKRFIPKIMFMCAVANPIFLTNGDVFFDGKIGIWPFITQEPAKRSSKNRKEGGIDQTIRAKWPHGMSKHIFIQLDNAKPHIAHNDNEFMEEALNDDFFHTTCTTTTKFS